MAYKHLETALHPGICDMKEVYPFHEGGTYFQIDLADQAAVEGLAQYYQHRSTYRSVGLPARQALTLIEFANRSETGRFAVFLDSDKQDNPTQAVVYERID
jgi:hypothetical protein